MYFPGEIMYVIEFKIDNPKNDQNIGFPKMVKICSTKPINELNANEQQLWCPCTGSCSIISIYILWRDELIENCKMQPIDCH